MQLSGMIFLLESLPHTALRRAMSAPTLMRSVVTNYIRIPHAFMEYSQ